MTKPSKIICVGRNYADHAKELGSAIPDTPILFIKPPSSLTGLNDGITWQAGLGSCHFECELSIQIGQTLKNATEEQARAAISGVTLGLDLTLRDLQNSLKDQGYPWERSKSMMVHACSVNGSHLTSSPIIKMRVTPLNSMVKPDKSVKLQRCCLISSV
jgi:2-keto-4-pentenoate hydratase/2-oxohepta-3-ene-1,7-dioic acid hydratase in catechol pathway